MKNKKNIIIVSIVVLVVVGLLILQVININNKPKNKDGKIVTPVKEKITDDVEINYKEGIKLNSKDSYIEFDINGNNKEDVIYDINIKKIDGKIEDNKLKFTLMKKVNDGEYITVVDNMSYNNLKEYYRMYIDVLPKDNNIIHTYRLSMKEDSNIDVNIEIKVNGNVIAKYKAIG